MTLLAGLDLGTTTIKAVVYDTQAGKVVGSAHQPTPVSHPQPDWSEHDPQALWEAACLCLRSAAQGKAVRALAISSMAEAGVALDRSGNTVGPAIAWYDRRSTPQAAQVEARVGREALFAITGQRATASFGLTKWLWLRENHPEFTRKAESWLPLPAYILFRLCGERATDYSIASRALLFDQNTLDWSAPLLALAGLQRENLPKPAPGGTAVGQVTKQAAAECGLAETTICVLGGHDHLCAAFAAGGARHGAAVDSTGTAEAVVLLIPAFQADSLLGERGFACYAHVLPGQFALKGGLKAAGSSIEWLARMLAPTGGSADYQTLESEARAGLGRKGPLWLPHLLESGSPDADPFSRGALVGARLEHERGDLFRGLLEGLACWTRQNLTEMQAAAHIPVENVTLLGGTTRLELFNQIKADVLGRTVDVPQIPEAAGVGAALLAGIGCSVFSSVEDALASLRYGSRRFFPDPARSSTYDDLYQRVYLPLYGALRVIHHQF